MMKINNGWNSILEEKPNDGQVVLISNTRTITQGWWYDGWRDWCKEASYDKVWVEGEEAIYWMSLPELPKIKCDIR